MSYDVEAEEFVQIVHNQHGHWFTISTIGVNHPAVNVYDSMYQSVSTQAKVQIAALLHTKAREITLTFIKLMFTFRQHCAALIVAYPLSQMH